MHILKEKIETIKKITNYFSSEIYKLLEDEIKKAYIKEGLKQTTIHKYLETTLNKKLSFQSLKKFIFLNKEKWKKEVEIKCEYCKYYHIDNKICTHPFLKKRNKRCIKVDDKFGCILIEKNINS